MRHVLGNLEQVVAPKRVVRIVDVVLRCGNRYASPQQLENRRTTTRRGLGALGCGHERDMGIGKNRHASAFDQTDDSSCVCRVVKGKCVTLRAVDSPFHPKLDGARGDHFGSA